MYILLGVALSATGFVVGLLALVVPALRKQHPRVRLAMLVFAFACLVIGVPLTIVVVVLSTLFVTSAHSLKDVVSQVAQEAAASAVAARLTA